MAVETGRQKMILVIHEKQGNRTNEAVTLLPKPSAIPTAAIAKAITGASNEATIIGWVHDWLANAIFSNTISQLLQKANKLRTLMPIFLSQ